MSARGSLQSSEAARRLQLYSGFCREAAPPTLTQSCHCRHMCQPALLQLISCCRNVLTLQRPSRLIAMTERAAGGRLTCAGLKNLGWRRNKLYLLFFSFNSTTLGAGIKSMGSWHPWACLLLGTLLWLLLHNNNNNNFIIRLIKTPFYVKKNGDENIKSNRDEVKKQILWNTSLHIQITQHIPM